MEVNYKNSTICITNSIMKYFDIEPYHETLDELDKLLLDKNIKMLFYLF